MLINFVKEKLYLLFALDNIKWTNAKPITKHKLDSKLKDIISDNKPINILIPLLDIKFL